MAKPSLFTTLALVLPVSMAQAVPQSLRLPDGRQLMANFPCRAEEMRAATATGEAVAKQCSINMDASFCNFMLVDAKLDLAEYQRGGFSFLKKVHHEYAKSLDPSYISKRLTVRTLGTLGQALDYEFLRGAQGAQMQVTGFWLPSGDRLLRITATCLTNAPPALTREKSQFLSSFAVVR